MSIHQGGNANFFLAITTTYTTVSSTVENFTCDIYKRTLAFIPVFSCFLSCSYVFEHVTPAMHGYGHQMTTWRSQFSPFTLGIPELN